MKKSEILEKLNKAIVKLSSIIDEETDNNKVPNASNALVALVKTYNERFGFEDDVEVQEKPEQTKKKGVVGNIGKAKGF